MQFKDVRPQSFTSRVRCDRCGLEARHDEVEFQEIASIDLRAGYGSVVGDGCNVQIDLCQHCLKQTLSPWLRVDDPTEGEVLDSLHLFDPKRHGGEFPSHADRSLDEPEDLPRQGRRLLDADLSVQIPQAGTPDVPLNVSADSDAPLPAAVLQSVEERLCDAQAVLHEIEVRNDQGTCSIADRCEHSVIKNLCRSIQDHVGTVNDIHEHLGRQLARTKQRLADG